MKILFMGTPDFARAHLAALIGSEHSVTAVISQPDKPKGRKKILTAPPADGKPRFLKIFYPTH